MTPYEIATIILVPLALSMGYAFKKHNDEVMKYQREEQNEYYQYVKNNWMYLNGGDNE